MRRKIIIFFVIIGVFIGLWWMNKVGFMRSGVEKEPVNIFFLGDKKYKEAFDQSSKSGKVFSDLFGAGLNSKEAGDYETAIKLFNECLPHAALGPEVAMVYKQLSEIYRAQGNLERELEYLEKISKYTMSDRIKRESASRAEEIRQISKQQ